MTECVTEPAIGIWVILATGVRIGAVGTLGRPLTAEFCCPFCCQRSRSKNGLAAHHC